MLTDEVAHKEGGGMSLKRQLVEKREEKVEAQQVTIENGLKQKETVSLGNTNTERRGDKLLRGMEEWKEENKRTAIKATQEMEEQERKMKVQLEAKERKDRENMEKQIHELTEANTRLRNQINEQSDLYMCQLKDKAKENNEYLKQLHDLAIANNQKIDENKGKFKGHLEREERHYQEQLVKEEAIMEEMRRLQAEVEDALNNVEETREREYILREEIKQLQDKV